MFRPELIEPEADDLTEAIGFAVYCNGKPTINYLHYSKNEFNKEKRFVLKSTELLVEVKN